jgi:mRNA interferase MazF
LVRPVKGDVVVVPFPFSDLSGSKRRPALVLAELPGDDRILCMITSQAVADPYAVALDSSGFSSGNLSSTGNIRPSRLFTAESSIVLYVAGKLSSEKMAEVQAQLTNLFA